MKQIYPKQQRQRGSCNVIALLLIILLSGVVASAQTTSWKGTSSTSWSNSANWSNGVPSATVNAVVGDSKFTGTNQPTISYASSCKSLTIGGTKTAVITINGPVNVSGNVVLNSNGSMSLDAPLTLAGDWNNSGNFTAVSANSLVVFGGAIQSVGGSKVTTFRKLTINAGSTLNMNNNMAITGTGNLFTISGTLNPNESPAYVATVNNVILNDGSTVKITTAQYTGNYIITGNVVMNPGFTVEYASNTVNQIITNVLVYSNLKISGSSTKTLAGSLYPMNSAAADRGNIYINGGTLDIGSNVINRGTTVAGGTISVGNGAKLRIGGTNTFPTNYANVTLGPSGTVEYYGSNQSIRALNYGNLTLTNTGTKTAAGTLDMAGDFTLSGATFVAGAYTHSVGGDWSMTSGTFTNTGSTITFDGIEDQVLNSTAAFNSVRVNKASGAVTLGSDATVKALSFTKGVITTNNYKVIIPSGGSVSGAGETTGWVNGNLQEYFSAIAGGTFEVGGPAHYTPLTISFGAISTAGNLIAGVTASAHPNINTSTISNKNISRYWRLTKPATGALVYNTSVLTFNWNAADNYSPMTSSALQVAKYTSSAWSYPTKSGTSTSTNIKITGVTTQGDFAVGETNACTISSGFSFAGNSYCSNGSSIAPTMNTGATKGTFTSSPAGLSINATTGVITPSASAAGTYVITNTAVSGSCRSTSNFTVNIVEAPSATISYGSAVLCQTGALKSVVRSGKAGGTYRSTAGLDLDPTTGQVDPSGSTPGTYTVTYTINAASGCAAFSTTASVTITEPGFALISYPESPYCRATGGTAKVEITGATGGSFSPVSGLSINTTTGDINLGASTAGTYTVTYNAPAANGCAAFSTSTTITINATATATINYAGSPFCGGTGIINVSHTGTTGGTYDSDGGLDLDETTGAINLSNSQPGTYTVVYNGAGCPATTTVVINAVPAATINYSAASFCTTGGTANVTVNGTAGGTFKAGAGLSLNTTTGAIDLAASTAGNYTVTYTIAAANNCAAFSTTTSIAISKSATAAIAYAGTPFCGGTGSANVTLTGTSGGVFSAPAGLSINAASGAINLSSSVAGSYTVKYTLPASGACSAVEAQATVVIAAVPSASISYSDVEFCKTTGLQNVTRTGTSGGTYSATPAGLVINASTGAITPSASGVGSYTITYTIAAANNCSKMEATAAVTIKAAPTAGISYVASPYCVTGGTANVTLTGTTGGTFSSTSGLSINTTTGAINLAASTAGNYTVTYTIAAGNKCSQVSTTTAITIVAAPTASISYSGGSFCVSSSTTSVTRTGASGGTYSASPSGLSISSSTGAITPASSAVGTYTVSYTLPAANGCAAVVVKTTVAITTNQTPVISYASSPYCVAGGTAYVTLTGATGGVYSGSNVVINAATGAINLAATGAGKFEIKYNVSASGGCSAAEAKTEIIINPSATATILYKDNPYFNSESSKSVEVTGTKEGTFTASNSSLVIDAATGTIYPSISATGTYTVTYTINNGTGCQPFVTTTQVTINPYYKWNGSVNTSWKEGKNWSGGSAPGDKSEIIIPSGVARYPSILAGESGTARDVIMENGAKLTVVGTLQLTGSINANAKSISAALGTLELKSEVPQTIPGNVFDGELANLFIENEAGITLTSQLSIGDIVTIKKGFINTNGHLVIKSSSVKTARIGAITSTAVNPIIGEVTVERYVAGRRKYRLITSSVTTSTAAVLPDNEASKSIWGNWQNGGVATPGVGTIITGGTVADGFDQGTGNASIYTYNDITKKFVAFTSTNGKNTKKTPLKAGVGYYMFVYGDRINSIVSSTPNPTTLIQKGTVLTGPQVYTPTTPIAISNVAGNFSLIGNPYACTIDWNAVSKTNISKTIWGWDANLNSTGGYVTVTSTLLGELISPLSNKIAVNRYIQPGQAFFVQTTKANPHLMIEEKHKIDDKMMINSNVFRENNANEQSLIAVNLMHNNGISTAFFDGALAAFDASYSNEVDYDDAYKITGSAESLSLNENGNMLSISTRNLPADNDSIGINLGRITKSQYTLQIFTKHMDDAQAKPWLYDAFLDTYQPLSLTDTNYVDFTVKTTDAASFANRFKIVFKNNSTLPVKFGTVSAAKKDDAVAVKWDVASESNIEKYDVQRSTDGTTFNTIGSVASKGNNSSLTSYVLQDGYPDAGINYYRIKSVQKDGSVTYSKVVTIRMDKAVNGATIYPNPVSESINFQMNNVKAGAYHVSLYNAGGQQVISQTVKHSGGSAGFSIQLPKDVAKGMYTFVISGDDYKSTLPLVIQ